MVELKIIATRIRHPPETLIDQGTRCFSLTNLSLAPLDSSGADTVAWLVASSRLLLTSLIIAS